MRDGAAKIPCYRCYVGGEEVEVGAGSCGFLDAARLPSQPCPACACTQPVAEPATLVCPAPVPQSYAGGIPAEVAKMVARQLAQLRGSGGGLLAKLLLAAAAAGAAAAAAYLRFGRPQGGSQERDLGAEMRSLADRINIAQQRLR